MKHTQGLSTTQVLFNDFPGPENGKNSKTFNDLWDHAKHTRICDDQEEQAEMVWTCCT